MLFLTWNSYRLRIERQQCHRSHGRSEGVGRGEGGEDKHSSPSSPTWPPPQARIPAEQGACRPAGPVPPGVRDSINAAPRTQALILLANGSYFIFFHIQDVGRKQQSPHLATPCFH